MTRSSSLHALLTALLLAAVFLVPREVRAHDMAMSYFEVVPTGESSLELAFQLDAQGIVEAVTNRETGAVTEDRVREVWSQAIAYLDERFRLETPGGACTGSPARDVAFDGVEQRVRFARSYRCPGPVGDRLVVDSELFLDAPTLHHVSGRVWLDGCGELFFFSKIYHRVPVEKGKLRCEPAPTPKLFERLPEGGSGSARAAGRPGGGARRLLLQFIPEGIFHILTGYDHVLFVISLLGGAIALRQLIPVVTAFTIAHSLTLLLAVVGALSAPGVLVEIAIAASILYVAVENLVLKEVRYRVALAFCFGLVHGLGFSGFLREILPSGGGLLWGLLGFNVGVELGQLLIVLPCVPVLLLLQHHVRFETWRRVTNVLLAAVAAWWTLDRILGAGIA